MITHTGRDIPLFPYIWDQLDVQWVTFVWDSRLGGAQVTASQWTVPQGWSILDQGFNVPVVNPSNGAEYTKVTAVRLSCAGIEPGEYVIENQVEFGDGLVAGVLNRGVRIIVGDV